MKKKKFILLIGFYISYIKVGIKNFFKWSIKPYFYCCSGQNQCYEYRFNVRFDLSIRT